MTASLATAPHATLVATGLDGSNPLGFLAALGLLRVLDVRRRVDAGETPRLAWNLDGYWQPTFHGIASIDEVTAIVLEDKAEWHADPAVLLAYDDAGALVDPTTDPRCTRDLKPVPAAMRAFLLRMAELSHHVEPETSSKVRRSLDMGAAYGSEVVQDNKGNTKPTAFHFTAGQQRFLGAVTRLQQGVSGEHIREAVLGPWSGASSLPSMSWDGTVSRNYALRAANPSHETRGSNPGADWLAFVGLSFTMSVPRRGRLVTTGTAGGWKNSAFTWPLWTVPLCCDVIRPVLATTGLADLPDPVRRARGIGAVMSAAITRSDQGGYGGFAPSAVV